MAITPVAAIEIHGRITASGACVFIKIHKYVASSRHQLIRRPTNLIASLQDADFVYYSFKTVSISSKKPDVFSLPCNFM